MGLQFTQSMPPLSEAQVSETISGFLKAHGWKVLRWQRTVVTIKGQTFSTGERGVADKLFIFYLENRVPKEFRSCGVSLTLWIETKSPNDRRSCTCLRNYLARKPGKACTVCDQKKWQEHERARGAQVWELASYEAFEAKYRETYGWMHRGERALGQLELI